MFAHYFASCVCVNTWIFSKIILVFTYFLVNGNIKYWKDPRVPWGDIIFLELVTDFLTILWFKGTKLFVFSFILKAVVISCLQKTNVFLNSVCSLKSYHTLEQGIIFFMTSWGYAFFTKNFLWKKWHFIALHAIECLKTNSILFFNLFLVNSLFKILMNN